VGLKEKEAGLAGDWGPAKARTTIRAARVWDGGGFARAPAGDKGTGGADAAERHTGDRGPRRALSEKVDFSPEAVHGKVREVGV
jgi:hypothetical protein